MKFHPSSFAFHFSPVLPTCLAIAGLVLLGAPRPGMAASPVVVEVGVREAQASRAFEASVEAVRQATVGAQVSGRVVEMRVDAGQRVSSGQVLLRLDSRESQASSAAADARLIRAEANYQRNRSLRERNFISQSALDQAEADYKAARADAQGAAAGASHGAVTAPLSGVVGQRLVQTGDMVTPGKDLVTVFDPRSLRVVAQLPQSALAAVSPGRGGAKGQGSEINALPSLKGRIEFIETGRWVDAQRIEILPTLDPVTRSATVRAYLPEQVSGLLPGMAARLHLQMGASARLQVPPAALVQRGELTAVYVVDGQGMPHLRQIRLGERGAEGVEVVAGLVTGERVAADAALVRPGKALLDGASAAPEVAK